VGRAVCGKPERPCDLRASERYRTTRMNKKKSIFFHLPPKLSRTRGEKRMVYFDIVECASRCHTDTHDTYTYTQCTHTQERFPKKKKKLSIILPSNELNKRMIIRFVINYIYIFQYFNYLLNVNYIHIYKYIHICIIYIIVDIYIIYILYIHTLNARRMREREGCGDEGRLAESLARKREKKIEGEGHY